MRYPLTDTAAARAAADHLHRWAATHPALITEHRYAEPLPEVWLRDDARDVMDAESVALLEQIAPDCGDDAGACLVAAGRLLLAAAVALSAAEEAALQNPLPDRERDEIACLSLLTMSAGTAILLGESVAGLLPAEMVETDYRFASRLRDAMRDRAPQ